jgi:hypothetical protein
VSSLTEILANTMSFVRSQEANQALGAITLDTALQQQIAQLQSTQSQSVSSPSTATPTPPTQLDTLLQLQQQFDSAVQAISNAGNDPAKLAALGLTPASTAGST